MRYTAYTRIKNSKIYNIYQTTLGARGRLQPSPSRRKKMSQQQEQYGLILIMMYEFARKATCPRDEKLDIQPDSTRVPR